MQNIEDLIKNATNAIKNAMETTEIVGKPIVNGDGTIILPVNKISFGFVVGGMDERVKAAPVGASGGGVSVVPVGFLICGREKRFVSVDETSNNKWANLFGDIIACVKKGD